VADLDSLPSRKKHRPPSILSNELERDLSVKRQSTETKSINDIFCEPPVQTDKPKQKSNKKRGSKQSKP